MSMGDMNTMSINIKEFLQLIREDFMLENYDPILIFGKSGVGKTVSVCQLAKELGIGYREVRLANMNELDLFGLPQVVDGRTTYAVNDLLPVEERDGEVGILALDEITSASQNIRAAAYQLLDSKRALGNYKLPDKWKVVAMGNGVNDGGVFQGMENAFLNRMRFVFRVEPEFEAWKDWAIANGIHKSVLAFLSFDPSKIHVMGDPDEPEVFPSPRSWEAFSKVLKEREKLYNQKQLDSNKVELFAAGTIGYSVAPEFAAFYSYNSSVVDVKDIMDGNVEPSILNDLEPEIVYLLLESLSEEVLRILGEKEESAREENIPVETVKKIANLVNWIIDASSYRLDYAVMMISEISSRSEKFRHLVMFDDTFDENCPKYMDFCSDNSIVFGED